mgnify:CR=1 FL=1
MKNNIKLRFFLFLNAIIVILYGTIVEIWSEEFSTTSEEWLLFIILLILLVVQLYLIVKNKLKK